MSDIDLGPFVDATSELMAALCTRHPEGRQLLEDARTGRTSTRLIYDHRLRHLAVLVIDERGLRPVASIDVAELVVEFSPYAERPPAEPVH